MGSIIVKRPPPQRTSIYCPTQIFANGTMCNLPRENSNMMHSKAHKAHLPHGGPENYPP